MKAVARADSWEQCSLWHTGEACIHLKTVHCTWEAPGSFWFHLQLPGQSEQPHSATQP